MASAELKQSNQERQVITKERRDMLIEGAGVIVTAAGLLSASLLAVGAGLVIFEFGRRLKKPKKN